MEVDDAEISSNSVCFGLKLQPRVAQEPANQVKVSVQGPLVRIGRSRFRHAQDLPQPAFIFCCLYN
jgi:hypothetical protein